MVTAVAAWSIWGNDMFPAKQDPVGGMLIKPWTCSRPRTNETCMTDNESIPKDPEDWTYEEMRTWLRLVSLIQ